MRTSARILSERDQSSGMKQAAVRASQFHGDSTSPAQGRAPCTFTNIARPLTIRRIAILPCLHLVSQGCSATPFARLRSRVGIFPLVLTVLNRHSITPYDNPYEGLFVEGGTSQGSLRSPAMGLRSGATPHQDPAATKHILKQGKTTNAKSAHLSALFLGNPRPTTLVELSTTPVKRLRGFRRGRTLGHIPRRLLRPPRALSIKEGLG